MSTETLAIALPTRDRTLEAPELSTNILLDSLRASFQKALEQPTAFTNLDDLLMAEALAVVDTAAANYSPADARLLNMIQSVSQVLAELGCNGHGHFLDSVSERLGLPQSVLASQTAELHDEHEHNEDEPGVTKRRNKKKRRHETADAPRASAMLLKKTGEVTLRQLLFGH